MPLVNGKKFAYTPKGKAAAKKAAVKKKDRKKSMRKSTKRGGY
tara:strand:- start:449 stop:577 length:129 start_codon:yes stop_codon:yes gene_type:complete